MMKLKSPTRTVAMAATALCVATAWIPSGASASNFPVFPGAKSVAVTQPKAGMDSCGQHIKTTILLYKTATGAKAVASWYRSQMPGALFMDLSTADSTDKNVSIEVMKSDGSGAAIVSQMTFANAKLQAANETLDANGTSIGLETFSPPIDPQIVSLSYRAAHHDASALAQLKAKCPNH
jgi:hypothetical protein